MNVLALAGTAAVTMVSHSAMPHSSHQMPSYDDNPDLRGQLHNYRRWRDQLQRQQTMSRQLGRNVHPDTVRNHQLQTTRVLNPLMWPKLSEQRWEDIEMLENLKDMWGREVYDSRRPPTSTPGYSYIERLPVKRRGFHTRWIEH